MLPISVFCIHFVICQIVLIPNIVFRKVYLSYSSWFLSLSIVRVVHVTLLFCKSCPKISFYAIANISIAQLGYSLISYLVHFRYSLVWGHSIKILFIIRAPDSISLSLNFDKKIGDDMSPPWIPMSYTGKHSIFRASKKVVIWVMDQQ